MQIFIKILTGKTIGVDVDSDTTSLDIKRQIFEKEGIKITDQILIVAGKAWSDDQTYSTFHAENPGSESAVWHNATLHMVVNLIPENLRSLVAMDYQTLKAHSADIACEISQTTRTERYAREDHPDTETHWNSLNKNQKAKVLSKPEFASLIASALQEATTSSRSGVGASTSN